MDVPTNRFDDEVVRRLHEVMHAAREVPAEAQPKRLKDALASLVALDVISTGTYAPQFPDSSYTPSAGPSS